jgi:hypothetical protein
MAASNSKPTRVSKRIINIKKTAADAAIAAAAAAAVVVTKNTHKANRNLKAPTKITKRGRPTKKSSPRTVNKTSPNEAKNANAAHHRFFLEPEQLSDVLEQRNASPNADEMIWISGAFHAADPGVEVPVGSVEIEIKVPKGLKFLRFPGVVKLVAVEEEGEEDEMEEEGEEDEMEEEGEEDEMEEGENEEAEDSELSELSE